MAAAGGDLADDSDQSMATQMAHLHRHLRPLARPPANLQHFPDADGIVPLLRAVLEVFFCFFITNFMEKLIFLDIC
jgi:hypothetical protein